MSRAGQRTTGGADAGFTVIELTVAMVIAGMLMALTATGWNRYLASQEAVSASGEVVSVLRNAQMRATAEATTYRVDVDPATRRLTVFRYDGATYVQRTTSTLSGGDLVLQAAAFRDQLGATTTSAYFYARGTASPGSVVVRRADSDKERTITVEGLTGRVWTT